MKILVVHNLHRKGSASGDDQVFKSETKLLEENGIDVIKYTISNDEFDNSGIIKKLKSVFGMFWSFKHYRNIKKIIKNEKPDLMHVHTFFPLISPSILYAAKRSKLKVVATLHDTRFICPCAISIRNNELCNKCRDGKYFRMCKYKCYKNSRIQSFVVATIFKYHRLRKSFYKQIDKYICLNDNQIDLLIKTGFDSNKIVKKYNFIEDVYKDVKSYSINSLPKRYVVYYGRLGEEKGIRNLMQIWNKIDDIPIVVMGGGPLEDEFKEWSKSKDNVYFLGYTEHDKCLNIVKKCEFVVFPSICYEGCSMVQIESQCLGKAIVANDLGFSKESIIDNHNGIKAELNNIDDFVKKIRYLWKQPEKIKKMGKNARNDYLLKYLPNNNYIQLKNIYNSLLEEI